MCLSLLMPRGRNLIWMREEETRTREEETPMHLFLFLMQPYKRWCRRLSWLFPSSRIDVAFDLLSLSFPPLILLQLPIHRDVSRIKKRMGREWGAKGRKEENTREAQRRWWRRRQEPANRKRHRRGQNFSEKRRDKKSSSASNDPISTRLLSPFNSLTQQDRNQIPRCVRFPTEIVSKLQWLSTLNIFFHSLCRLHFRLGFLGGNLAINLDLSLSLFRVVPLLYPQHP